MSNEDKEKRSPGKSEQGTLHSAQSKLRRKFARKGKESGVIALEDKTPEMVAKALFGNLRLFDLPLATYLVDKDDRFLECSPRVRKLLDLPEDKCTGHSLGEFYDQPSLRYETLRKAREKTVDDECHSGGAVQLNVAGRAIYVRDTCHPLRDSDNNQVVGFFGCLLDVTEEEHYRQLFEKLPTGVYRLDAEDSFVEVNDALVSMLGYQSKDQIVGHNVREFVAHPDRVEDFTKRMKSEGKVVKGDCQVVKQNGETAFLSVNSIAVWGANNHYEGRMGTAIDVTKDEKYRIAREGVPIGYYEIHREKDRDIIDDCNSHFLEIFQFASKEQATGYEVSKLYADPKDYEKFMCEFNSKVAAGEIMHRHQEKVVTYEGGKINIEVTSKPIKDKDGAVIGRTGVVYVIEDKRLRADMETLQADIGQVLHSYTATLLTVIYANEAAVAYLSPDPFEKDWPLLADSVNRTLDEAASRLTGSLDEILQLDELGWRQRGIGQKYWDELNKLFELLSGYKDRIGIAEFRPPTLRQAARRIVRLCDSALKGKMPRESIRRIKADARELERISCLVPLHHAREGVVSIDHSVRSLRDYVTRGVRHRERDKVPVRFWRLVEQAMSNLEEFAHSQGVKFKRYNDAVDAWVEITERDMLRALSNLLHNAIKYTWQWEDKRWVSVRVFTDHAQVYMQVKNYGVPISEDEIETVFKFGYRGQLSSDRGRLGTGIGLHDARSVAETHGGDVRLESHPASSATAPRDYSTPYITTVILSLPRAIGD